MKLHEQFIYEHGDVQSKPNIHMYFCFRVYVKKTHSMIDHILTDTGRHSSVLHVRSFRTADCVTEHYLVMAKVWDRLAVNKQRSHRFHMERFNLRKLN
jgi:hypothetical protein